MQEGSHESLKGFFKEQTTSYAPPGRHLRFLSFNLKKPLTPFPLGQDRTPAVIHSKLMTLLLTKDQVIGISPICPCRKSLTWWHHPPYHAALWLCQTTNHIRMKPTVMHSVTNKLQYLLSHHDGALMNRSHGDNEPLPPGNVLLHTFSAPVEWSFDVRGNIIATTWSLNFTFQATRETTLMVASTP